VAKKQEEKSKRSKKYQKAVEAVEKGKAYPLKEAVDLAKQSSYTKFNGTLELHINTSQKGIRGLVTMPYSAGKNLRILAFGKGAEDSGADIVGNEETIEEINKGKINFDVVVTTSEWMPKLAKVARILGPRGLMPNPKNGTITENLAKTVADLQGGKTEYKTEANGQVIHIAVGKVIQPTDEVSANVKALQMVLGKSRVKKLVISPTMGAGVKINPASI